VKDLPLSGQAVYLEVNRRHLSVTPAKFSEDLDFLRKEEHTLSDLLIQLSKKF